MPDLQAAHAAIDKHLRAEEGERLKPYRCTAGVPTIGVGATTYLDGRKVTMADPPITVEQMNRMLDVEVDRYLHSVLEMCRGEATTNQLIGLTICGYNIGLAGLRSSTMIRLHNAGDYAGAARAFSLWNKVTDPKTKKKVSSNALSARRLREAAIYATPDADDEQPRGVMPQAVAAEPALKSSPTVQASTGLTLAGIITALSQSHEHLGVVGDLITQLKNIADGLHVQPMTLLGVGLAIGGGTVLYRRIKQRNEGVA
jgi:lysozyme